MQFQTEKITKFTVKKNRSVFVFSSYFFFLQKRLIRNVNVLKINGFCRSLTDTSVNFQKPPQVNGILPSPRLNIWISNTYTFSFHLNLYVYFACMSVRLYPIKVKTSEPIGLKFFEGPRVTPWKGLQMIEFFKNLPTSNSIFEILKIHYPRIFVLFLLTQITPMLFINKEKPNVIY